MQWPLDNDGLGDLHNSIEHHCQASITEPAGEVIDSLGNVLGTQLESVGVEVAGPVGPCGEPLDDDHDMTM